MVESWPWKLIWRTRAPLKVTCFCWTALQDACLTQDNLRKRSFQIANRCYMCQNNEETNNHLFLHCPVAADVWNMFLSLFGFNWVMPQSTKEAFRNWNTWKVDITIKQIWRMIPASIFWCLWAERNMKCFDGVSTPIHSIKARCLMFLFSWHKLSPVDTPDSFLNFVSTLVLN